MVRSQLLAKISKTLLVLGAMTSLSIPAISQGSAPVIEAISLKPNGGIGSGPSGSGEAGGAGTSPARNHMDASGRLVVFESDSGSLICDDANFTRDIFLRDRQAGTTSLVSVSSDGQQANGASFDPAISANGRYVAFGSAAKNLAPGDTNNFNDIFLRDLQTGTTNRISVSSSGVQANSVSHAATISADGRFVAFESNASNLVPGDTNNVFDVFVHDNLLGTTERVSIAEGLPEPHGNSTAPAISSDGRYVAFQSDAFPFDQSAFQKAGVLVRDRLLGTTTWVSLNMSGVPTSQGASTPAISSTGRFVTFESRGDDLVPNEGAGFIRDVFVRDLQTQSTVRVSDASDGTHGNSQSNNPSITTDGRYVVFESFADNLAPGDTNGTFDVFLHDNQLGTTTLLSRGLGGGIGNRSSDHPLISDDGRFIYFQSRATNLVPNDINDVQDVFIYGIPFAVNPAGVHFDAATYSVNEDVANAVITVSRDGNTCTNATVNYSTSDGTASSGLDYSAASGSITFLPGQKSATFSVPITDDVLYEPNENINVSLSNAIGTSLTIPFAAVLTIVDNDPVPPVSSASSVIVASTANPANEQGSVTFTATVTAVPPATGTPTGIVHFMSDGALLDDGVLNGGVASVSAEFPAGSYQITAVYAGDATFVGSTSDPLTQKVNAQTPVGANVPVSLSVNGTSIQLVFAQVLTPGITIAQPGDPCRRLTPGDPCQIALPPNFIRNGALAFEISTTATFSSGSGESPIQLQFRLSPNTSPDLFSSMRIIHYVHGDKCQPGDPCVPQVLSTVRDAANKTLSASVSSLSPFMIALTSADDDEPPVTTASYSVAPTTQGWNNTDVLLSLTATDDGSAGVQNLTYSTSGVQNVNDRTSFGDSASISIGTEGVTTTSFFATDNNGNAELPQTVAIKVDKTTPSIDASRSPTANVYGWNNSDVTATFSCSDSLSGVASCAAPTVLNAEGLGLAATGSVTDNAGNTATAAIGGVNIDKTPPLLTAAISPAPNAAGWNTSDVTVTFSATDALSGVLNTSSPVTVNGEGAAQVITGSTVDRAGNLASTSAIVNIDKTAPEGYLQFITASRDIGVFGRDVLSGASPGLVSPSQVTATVWSSADDITNKTMTVIRSEQRTYRVLDAAGNTITMVVKVCLGSNALKARLVSLQYNGQPTLIPPANTAFFAWTNAPDGTPRDVAQLFARKVGPLQINVLEGTFLAASNQTQIVRVLPLPIQSVATRTGFSPIRVVTRTGDLAFEY
jgi:hypothetical protein